MRVHITSAHSFQEICQPLDSRLDAHYTEYKIEQLERLRSEIPYTATWLPILVIHIRSQVKTRQSQSYKLKNIAKYSNFKMLLATLHATHLLKLLDKMYKYAVNPTRTVGATERTRDAGRTDGLTDRRMEWNQYTPNNLVVWGYDYSRARPPGQSMVSVSQEYCTRSRHHGQGQVITSHRYLNNHIPQILPLIPASETALLFCEFKVLIIEFVLAVLHSISRCIWSR